MSINSTTSVGGGTVSGSTGATNQAVLVANGTAGATLQATPVLIDPATGTVTLPNSANVAAGTGAGTKIGTATSQKFGFWNATPIVQPTTAIAAATFVSNTSLIADDSATFDGYTLGQVVKALRNAGLLA